MMIPPASIRSMLLAAMASGIMSATTGAGEIGRGEVNAVLELTFRGPEFGPGDAPARDLAFRATFRHEDSGDSLTIPGFWDGDGQGGAVGDVFRVRFRPTSPGRWTLVAVESIAEGLDGQHRGDHVLTLPSDRPGGWKVDDQSPGRRWYRRDDGTHPYLIGNTHYTFLSGQGPDGPTDRDIAADVAGNAKFFSKLRFSLLPDRYPDPDLKPFFDDRGRPTDDGDFSHRPNPSWFHDRVDLAVAEAFRHDLVADLILCGPDTEDARDTLRAEGNGGDPTPWLRYVAARYGAFPNVWFCLCNEFDIKQPSYTTAEIARAGRTLDDALPYGNPVSVHASPRPLWPEAFDDLPPWADHLIIQNKLRDLDRAADVIGRTRSRGRPDGIPRELPVVNDELSYQGRGDRHDEGDTIAAVLGTFLGGGYGTTGEKPENKLGQYFLGGFDPGSHSAADNLGMLRDLIDGSITFWEMAPDRSVFEYLGEGSRGLARPGLEYVLGTDAPRSGLVADLPEGRWRVVLHDLIAKESRTLAEDAAGRYRFDAPESRAALFHFLRVGD